MEYTNLGRTGLEVSRLCLGTMNFGTEATENDSHAIMDRALELGINFFDTANSYGRRVRPGFTEEVIGNWFAQGGDRREKVVLATKVYSAMGDWPNERRLSARHIVASCEASLRRLRTDHLDLFQMHHVDRATPWDEIWQAMETLVAQGKVIYVGSSNFAGWHLAAAQEAAARRHFFGLVSEQCHYNLLTREPELELLPAAQQYGIGIIPWSPLAGGLLGGVLGKLERGGTPRSKSDHITELLAKHRPAVEAYERFCADLGHAPADVALAWLLAQPGVTAPIIGPRTMEQFDGTLGALGVTLDEATLAKLDEIFPPIGKGGPGPEAWAW